MEEFELAIIGGGIVGTCIFSQAVLSGINVVLLEKDNDVSSFATKANSGIVHSGYDPIPGTKMAIYNRRGNEMYEEMCKRLGIDFLKCGTLTVAPESGRAALEKLLERGKENGIPGLRLVERDELFEMEPNLQDEIAVALYAPTGAVVSPYMVCIALAEEGIINGGKVLTKFEVSGVQKQSDGYVLSSNNGDQVFAKYVINAAGPNANEIQKLFGSQEFPMRFVKGEYILLDKTTQGFINHPIFPLPTEKGKGILANITVHGNIMLGPTAVECDKDDIKVEMKGVENIQKNIIHSVKEPNFKKTIKLFAGVRVKSGNDFVVERDKQNKHYYYAVGICSPGLTAAPAIAEDFLKWLKEDGIKQTPLKSPQKRKPYLNPQKLNKKELKSLIKKNPSYGKVICKCENITEGEIIEALNSPLPPISIAGVKRRVSPTMGRCQGSYCIPKIIRIMANEKKRKRYLDKLKEK